MCKHFLPCTIATLATAPLRPTKISLSICILTASVNLATADHSEHETLHWLPSYTLPATIDITSVVWLLQGHALYTRQAGSTIPCPYVDYDKGFNAVFARAYGLKDGETIAKLFGSDWGELALPYCPW